MPRGNSCHRPCHLNTWRAQAFLTASARTGPTLESLHCCQTLQSAQRPTWTIWRQSRRCPRTRWRPDGRRQQGRRRQGRRRQGRRCAAGDFEACACGDGCDVAAARRRLRGVRLPSLQIYRNSRARGLELLFRRVEPAALPAFALQSRLQRSELAVGTPLSSSRHTASASGCAERKHVESGWA